MSAEVANRTDVVDAIADSGLVELVPANLPTSPEDVEAEVARAREQAQSIIVDSEATAEAALELAKAVKRRAGEIKAERVSLTKPRKDAAEEIKRVYDGMEAPFLAVEKEVKGTIRAWEKAEEKRVEEAQQAAEEERARIEAEARAKREEAEQAEREAAELAGEQTSVEDRRAAEELAAEARREAERAQVTEQAIASLPPEQAAAPPKLKGFSSPKRWTATVVDFDALPDKLPDGTPLKVVDKVALDRWMHGQVKVNGGVAPELPGAKFEKVETGSAVRA